MTKIEFKSQRKSGILLSYAIIISDSLLGIVYTPILLKSLGDSEYGLYQLIGSLVNYFAIMDFGLGATIMRYFIKYNTEEKSKERDNFFAMALIVYGVIGIIILFLGGTLSFFLGDIFKSLKPIEIVEAKVLMGLLIINLIITLFDHAFSGVLNSFEQFTFDKGLRLSRVIFRAVLVIVLLQFYSNAIVIVVVDFVLTLVILLIKIHVCTHRMKVVPKLYIWDVPLLKEVFFFTFAIFMQAIINLFNNNVDKTVLGIYTTTTAVAIYSIAMQIYSAYSGISTAIQSVYLPKISKIVFNKGNNRDITLSLVQPSRYQLMILCCVCSAFWLFGYEFIYLWCGKTEAWLIACLVMTAGSVDLFQNSTSSVLKAKNMQKGRTFINLFTAMGNFTITLLLVPQYGMLGAAIGTVFTLIIGYIIFNNIYYKYWVGIEIGLYFKSVLKGFYLPVILSVIFGILVSYIPIQYGWIGFGVKSITYILVYMTLIYCLALNENEKNNFKKLIPVKVWNMMCKNVKKR